MLCVILFKDYTKRYCWFSNLFLTFKITTNTIQTANIISECIMLVNVDHCIEKTSIHSWCIIKRFYHWLSRPNSTQSKPPRTTPICDNHHVRNIRSWTLHTIPSFHLGSQLGSSFLFSFELQATRDLYIKDNAKQAVEGRKEKKIDAQGNETREERNGRVRARWQKKKKKISERERERKEKEYTEGRVDRRFHPSGDARNVYPLPAVVSCRCHE